MWFFVVGTVVLMTWLWCRMMVWFVIVIMWFMLWDIRMMFILLFLSWWMRLSICVDLCRLRVAVGLLRMISWEEKVTVCVIVIVCCCLLDIRVIGVCRLGRLICSWLSRLVVCFVICWCCISRSGWGS